MVGEVAQLAPGTTVDQFTIVRLLGRGGMGEVYLARDASLGRRVALKLISLDQLGEGHLLRARFLYEARTTARFSHPNIVAIHAVGEYQERPYMALEYLEGQSLRDRLERGALALDEALRVAEAIAAALAEAHRHGVLHRDLKPGNVMLPQDGRPRVVDFGLAKGLAATVSADGAARSVGGVGPTPAPPFEHTQTGLRGTPHYMAPELWKEAEATAACDVWALGVVLYQLSCGRLPYGEQQSLFALAAHVASGDAVPGLDKLPDSLPQPLREVIAGCLEKSPERRPSAAAVASLLQALSRGEAPALPVAGSSTPGQAVAVGPTLPIEQATPAQQRRSGEHGGSKRTLVLVWVLLMLGLLGGGVWFYVGAWSREGPRAGASESRSRSKTKTKIEAKAKAESKTKMKAKMKAKSKTKMKAKSKTKMKAKSKTKAKPKAKSKTKTKTKAKSKTKMKAKTKTKMRAGRRVSASRLEVLAAGGRCKEVLAAVGDPRKIGGTLAERCAVAWTYGKCACKLADGPAARLAYRTLHPYLGAKNARVCKPSLALQQPCRWNGVYVTRYPTIHDIRYWGRGYKRCKLIRRVVPEYLKWKGVNNARISPYEEGEARLYWVGCACKRGDKQAARRMLSKVHPQLVKRATEDCKQRFKVDVLH